MSGAVKSDPGGLRKCFTGGGTAAIAWIVENTRKKPFSHALDVPNKRLKSASSSMIPNEPKITPELVASHGLKPDEYARILKLIGRVPTFTELGIFSAMWNEHCSYKSSRIHLRGLPTKAPWVIQGPGENAGVIDIGDGQAVVFKMESHNHPSYIEPYQGATTGVGGILRDVFTMGARPIACLIELRRAGASEDAASRVGCGGRRRRLRQFVRRAHRRRTGALPYPL
jgi:hypothetical protein